MNYQSYIKYGLYFRIGLGTNEDNPNQYIYNLYTINDTIWLYYAGYWYKTKSFMNIKEITNFLLSSENKNELINNLSDLV